MGNLEDKELKVNPLSLTIEEDKFALLPQETVATLLDLAQRGRIKELNEQLDALKLAGFASLPIITELKELTQRYRTREIESLLEAYLKGENIDA